MTILQAEKLQYYTSTIKHRQTMWCITFLKGMNSESSFIHSKPVWLTFCWWTVSYCYFVHTVKVSGIQCCPMLTFNVQTKTLKHSSKYCLLCSKEIRKVKQIWNDMSKWCLNVHFWLDNHFKLKLKQACTLETLDILVKDTLAVTLVALIHNGSKTNSFGLIICGTLSIQDGTAKGREIGKLC